MAKAVRRGGGGSGERRVWKLPRGSPDYAIPYQQAVAAKIAGSSVNLEMNQSRELGRKLDI